MADDSNTNDTSKKSGLGFWKTVENPEVVKKIAEIGKEIEDYESLKTKVDALASALEDCNMHLSKVYEIAMGAIKINNAGFNTSMEGIQTLSTDISNSVSELRSIIGQIATEITKLGDEKKTQEGKRYTKEWVRFI